MASSPGQQTSVDFQTRVIMATGFVACLSCLVVVITGGFITAKAAKEGLQQGPFEAPIPMQDSQAP